MRLNTWLLLFCSTFMISQAQAAEPMYGLFMIVKGDVSFQAANGAFEKAKVGVKVYEGATIKTEKDSRAKIVMSDRNVLNISPDSKMVIQKYENSATKKEVTLSLEEGKVRVNVEQKYDGNKEKFNLKTPTVVAGVRGTQFLAAYDSVSKTSQIVTFKGSVSMTSFNSAGQAISSVTVEKGQSSTAAAGQAPEAPKAVPKEEMKALDKSSSASASDSKSEKGSAKAEKGDSAKSEKADAKNEKSDAKNEKGEQPKSEKGESTKNDKTEKKEASKVANSKDLDTSIAGDIKVDVGNSTGGQKQLILPPPPPPPQTPPKVPDVVRDIIQTNPKTKVNIKIQQQ
jgi:hypothetical protein